MLVGEPGIGKTRLAEEFGVYAKLRGAQVLAGRCYEGGVAVPYLPFVEAFRQYVRSRPDEALREELGAGAPEVATLVSEIRRRLPDLPEPAPLEGDAERIRLFESVASFVRSAAAANPLVLILDDLHWADKPTLLLLQFLARGIARERVLLVGGYRDVELERTHPLADIVAALRREQLYERVLLRGLSFEEVKHLVRARGGQEPPEGFVQRLLDETEGNPFFVEEVLRHLAEIGAIRREEGAVGGRSLADRGEHPRGRARGDRPAPLAPGRRREPHAQRRLGPAQRLLLRSAQPGGRGGRGGAARCAGRGAARAARGRAQGGRPRRLRVQPRADPPDPLRRAQHAAPGAAPPPDRRGAGGDPRGEPRAASRRARLSLLPGRAGRRGGEGRRPTRGAPPSGRCR